MKKIIHAIINFFKLLFLTLISPFLKNKKEKEQNVIIKSEKLEKLKKEQLNATGAVTGTPDDNNIMTNPHNNTTEETGETESTRIYTLPRQLERFLNPNEKYSYLAFSDEEIDVLINNELEDVYKEDGFKIYKANNIVKKNIEKLKKEIVPIIKDKIYYNNITNEKLLKREIKEIVAEHLLLTPIFEVKVEKEKKEPKKGKEDPYFLAMPRKKELDLPNEAVKVDSDDVIVNLESKEELDQKLEMPSLRMVQNTEEIKEPTLISELPKLAAGVALTAAKEAIEIVTVDSDLPKLKEEEKTEEEKDKKETVELAEAPATKDELPKEIVPEEEIELEKDELELPQLQETVEEKEEIENVVKEIVVVSEAIAEEVDEMVEEVDKSITEQEETEEKEEEQAKEEEKEQEEIEEKIDKNIILDMKIDSLDDKTFDVIDDAKKESSKSDFFEKDYDEQEKKINQMLDKISDTRIKYDKKLTEEQKERLKKQEEKLRGAKDKLELSREKDIAFEKKELDSTIKEIEIEGLKKEVDAMHLEYQMETNNDLLKKMDKLEGITKEQVAKMDRKILMSRFNKASFLLEMASLLAFPFVRNKYFRLFTIGLVVDNHLGFAHAFLNRKANRAQPVDLEGIRKGQDALDSAIDLAYKDLVQLDYIEEQALSRYPELADDPAYQASITRVRNNLTNQFNKLQNKQDTMERIFTKGRKQKKTLKRMEAAA